MDSARGVNHDCLRAEFLRQDVRKLACCVANKVSRGRKVCVFSISARFKREFAFVGIDA